MGNQACGGGRKEPKPPANSSQRAQAAGDRPQLKIEDRRRASSQQNESARAEKTQGQLDANSGEGFLAPSIDQHRQNEHSRRDDDRQIRNQTSDARIVDTNRSTGSSNLTLSHWAALQNEASHLLMQDKNNESLAKFKEALNVQVAVLGDRHPDIALTMNNLGIVSRACGRPEDSVAFFRQAVDICYEVMSSCIALPTL